MSNSTSNLDLLTASQSQKEVYANNLFDAAFAAMSFGRRASTSAGLTWGYYGGNKIISGTGTPTQIANGTIALTASVTNYVLETDGVVSVQTSAPAGWPGPLAGVAVALYEIVAGATSVTSYTDYRSYSGPKGAAGASYGGTSVTSFAIGTGSKAFTTQSGLAYTIGTRIRSASTANPTVNWMDGVVTAYSGTTLTATMDRTGGSGTHIDWSFSLAPGIDGFDSGSRYTFDSTTASADPTSGKFRLNNAALASVTALYISETDADINAIAAYIATWDDSTATNKGTLKIYNPTAPTNFAIYNITGSLTDNGAWDTLTLSYVTSGGSFTNGDNLRLVYSRTGDSGSNGTSGTGYAATSTTSLAIGTGSKAFTTQAGLAYVAGSRCRGIHAADTTKWMEGVVASYSGTTLTVTMDTVSGSGTFTDWNLSIAGTPGFQTRTIATPSWSSNMTLDWDTYDIYRITLAGATALTFSGGYDGKNCYIELTQDGTGSRTVTWPADARFSDDIPQPTLTTTINKMDKVGFQKNTTAVKYDCVAVVKGFA